jgi:hypothetical protein
MNRIVLVTSVAVAFAAGLGAARFVPPAWAAETITAQIVHVPDLNGEALGMASGTGLRSKMLVSADGMTISVQDGNVPKHMHPNTNEMQYILEGTGTICARRQGSPGKAGRSCRHSEGYGARRHQAGRPHIQGHRDQDPAAGSGRQRSGAVTGKTCRRHAAGDCRRLSFACDV